MTENLLLAGGKEKAVSAFQKQLIAARWTLRAPSQRPLQNGNYTKGPSPLLWYHTNEAVNVICVTRAHMLVRNPAAFILSSLVFPFKDHRGYKP